MLNMDGIAKAKSADGRKEIEDSLSAHLKTINDKLDPHEQMDCLVVVTEPWSVDNGFITPTFKVRRNRIEEVYGPNYEKWVGARKKVVWTS
jgi:long-chain acyl-CoA synthetase